MSTKTKIQNFFENTFLPAVIKYRPSTTKVTSGVLTYSECKDNDGLNQKFNVCGAIEFFVTKEDDSVKSFYVVVNRAGHFALVSSEDVERCNKTPKWNLDLNRTLSIEEQDKLINDRAVTLLAVDDISKVMEVAFS